MRQLRLNGIFQFDNVHGPIYRLFDRICVFDGGSYITLPLFYDQRISRDHKIELWRCGPLTGSNDFSFLKSHSIRPINIPARKVMYCLSGGLLRDGCGNLITLRRASLLPHKMHRRLGKTGQ